MRDRGMKYSITAPNARQMTTTRIAKSGSPD
jgi:hypothetical protein